MAESIAVVSVLRKAALPRFRNVLRNISFQNLIVDVGFGLEATADLGMESCILKGGLSMPIEYRGNFTLGLSRMVSMYFISVIIHPV
jgi:hypothetical protein